MSARLQDDRELELRLQQVLDHAELLEHESLDRRDYRNLLLVCVALPAALLVAGWFL